jgi:AhpD family alkylhydroperoxidase
MSRLTIHDSHTSPEASSSFIHKAIANNGFLPNLIGVLSGSPAAVETYFTVGEINSRSSLNLAEREVVQLTAARLHQCDFCIAGHTAIALKKAGFSSTDVLALHRGGLLDSQRLNALVAFTTEIIRTKGNTSDTALADFFNAGFTQQNALDVVLGISLATLCNFANVLAQSPINPELQPYQAGQYKG